jgi:hypothetical protein
MKGVISTGMQSALIPLGTDRVNLLPRGIIAFSGFHGPVLVGATASSTNGKK